MIYDFRTERQPGQDVCQTRTLSWAIRLLGTEIWVIKPEFIYPFPYLKLWCRLEWRVCAVQVWAGNQFSDGWAERRW